MKHLTLAKKLKRYSVKRFIASSLLVPSFATEEPKRPVENHTKLKRNIKFEQVFTAMLK
jgi:hypothetical protein